MSETFSPEEISRLEEVQDKRTEAEEFFKDDVCGVSEEILALFKKLPDPTVTYDYLLPLAEMIHIQGEEYPTFKVRALHLSAMYESWCGIKSLITGADVPNQLPTKMVMSTIEGLSTNEDYEIVLELAHQLAGEEPLPEEE